MKVLEMGAFLQMIWMDTTYHHTYFYGRQKTAYIQIDSEGDRKTETES